VLWIDPKTSLLKRFTLVRNDGKIQTAHVVDIVTGAVNAPIPDVQFASPFPPSWKKLDSWGELQQRIILPGQAPTTRPSTQPAPASGNPAAPATEPASEPAPASSKPAAPASDATPAAAPAVPSVAPDAAAAAAVAAAVTGPAAPKLELTTLEGKPVDITKSPARVVVLDFWATWCPPCREGLPKLQAFYDDVKKSGASVEVFAVNLRETPDQIRPFWQQQKFTMPVLLDSDGKAFGTFNARGIPLTVAIAGGKVIFRQLGYDPEIETKLAAAIKVALEAK
jgi:thiol-disulfide isomerase/thioredoxin